MNTSETKPEITPEDSHEQKSTSETFEAPSRVESDNTIQKNWLTILIPLLAIGGVSWFFVAPRANTNSPAAVTQAPPARAVETETVSRGEGIRSIDLIGQVQASSIATIRAQTDGLVQQILVREGDRVTSGATIAVIDDSERRLALAQARARLATEQSRLARLEVGTRKEVIQQRRAILNAARARENEALDNLRRITTLVNEGALSQRSLVEARSSADTARAERLEAAATLAEGVAGPLPEEIAAQRAIVAAARAELDRAQLELDRTRVKARNAGVVQTREISAGDYLETADPVITVVDNRELEVFLELPEQLSGQVRAGKPVILTSRNLPEWKKEATITSVIPSAEAGSRRQLVRVSLDNPPEGLISGMAVRGELELNIDPNSIIVSRDALVRRGSRWLLFAVNEDNTAREVEVEIVADMGEKVAISSTELENGQQIVLRGGDGLRNGAPVRISLR